MPSKEYYAANAERLRAYNSAYLRTWRDTHPEKVAGYERRRADRLRGKWHIWRAVSRAVARGELVRPSHCGCGREGRVLAHHDDYSRPLDVLWLCGVCHVARHEWLKGQAA